MITRDFENWRDDQIPKELLEMQMHFYQAKDDFKNLTVRLGIGTANLAGIVADVTQYSPERALVLTTAGILGGALMAMYGRSFIEIGGETVNFSKSTIRRSRGALRSVYRHITQQNQGF